MYPQSARRLSVTSKYSPSQIDDALIVLDGSIADVDVALNQAAALNITPAASAIKLRHFYKRMRAEQAQER